MKINVTEKILNYEGNPIKEGEEGKEKDLTVRTAIAFALNALAREEIQTAEDKAKIYQLSTKLYSNNEPDFTLDDRKFIKDRAAKILPALWFGKLSELLEDPVKEEEKAPEGEKAKEEPA